MDSTSPRPWRRLLWGLALLIVASACALPTVEGQVAEPSLPARTSTPPPTSAPTATFFLPPTETPDTLTRLLPPTPLPGAPDVTPTPDSPRPRPSIRTETEWHVVQPGESIGAIAELYGIGAGQLANANGLLNPDFLSIGQVLTVPPPIVQDDGPSNKIIPDSALVYGPASILFDLNAFVGTWASYLNAYTETVEGTTLSGPGIVQLVAQRYSVDPRLLLAVLEMQGGWVRSSRVSAEASVYPVGYVNPNETGLFSQLSWAADQLNLGFYRWRAGWAGPFVFADGRVVPAGSGLNAGTAGVQQLFSQLMSVEAWRQAVSTDGLPAVYRDLFGDPFLTAIEPLVPDGLESPTLQLPFEPNTVWSFTGGPHSAWGRNAAWAALDFAPPGYALGCDVSDAWVTAVADGPILRAENGEVIQDLDGDGHEQTGWVILYLHVDSLDRVSPGAQLKAGDRIGHPSCEGGISNGKHLHLARRYNGEWIPADGELAFVMDGWVSGGLGAQYDGTMTRDGVRLEACSCRNEENQIAR
jgi:LasA protease